MNPTHGGGRAILLLRAALPHRLRVVGSSMEPTIVAGDRILVVPTFRVRVGQVVACTDPRDGRPVVKRVVGVGPAGIEVRGDNADASTDSRTFGPLRRSGVVGTAVYRYAPPGRVGRIPDRQ